MRFHLLRMIPGLAGILTVVAVLSLVVKDPVVAASTAFIGRFGVPGIAVAVLVLDVIPFIGDAPALIVAWAGGLGFAPILAAASLGAVAAGGVDGWVGRSIGHLPAVQRVMERFGVGPFLRRYGAWAVAFSALVPSPYSLVAMGAGAAGVPLTHVLLGALFRIPRLAVYLGLIALGWSAGDRL